MIEPVSFYRFNTFAASRWLCQRHQLRRFRIFPKNRLDALRFDEYLRTGQVANHTALAELGHVSRARISQIMNLLHLAPDIQEAILLLPRTLGGRDPIHLRQLQPIAAILDWQKQRLRWRSLGAVVGP